MIPLGMTVFTTEEHERILSEAQKNVPGVDGRPTMQPNPIDEGFLPGSSPSGSREFKGGDGVGVFEKIHI